MGSSYVFFIITAFNSFLQKYQCAWRGPREINQTYLARTTQASFLLNTLPLSLQTNVESISLLQRSLTLPSQTAGTNANGVSAQALLPGPIFDWKFLPPSCTFYWMFFDKWLWKPIGFLLKSWNFATFFQVGEVSSSHGEIHKLWKIWSQWLLFYKLEYLTMHPLTKIAYKSSTNKCECSLGSSTKYFKYW